LALNLGGSLLITLSTTVALQVFMDGANNFTNSQQIHNKSIMAADELASNLTDEQISPGGAKIIKNHPYH